MLLFVLYVILTLEYVEKIVWSEPFKWDLFASPFTWYYLFFSILQNEINNGMKVHSQLSGWLTLFHRSGPTIWMQLHHHPKHLPASQNNLFSLHSSLCQMPFEGLRKARRCWVRTSIVLLFKSMTKFTTFKPFTPEPPITSDPTVKNSSVI